MTTNLPAMPVGVQTGESEAMKALEGALHAQPQSGSLSGLGRHRMTVL
jgi:hypothetical protein